MTQATLSAGTPPHQAFSEDWLSVAVGLLVFFLALLAVFGHDLLGWVASTSIWIDPTRALGAASKAYAGLNAFAALAATYVALLVTLSLVALANGANVKKFALAFTVVFAIAYASWIIGIYAHLAAVTPADQREIWASAGR